MLAMLASNELATLELAVGQLPSLSFRRYGEPAAVAAKPPLRLELGTYRIRNAGAFLRVKGRCSMRLVDIQKH